jgi:PhnB protein
MARVTTYLNFPRTTEEAFQFYKAAFQTDFIGPVVRFGDGPPAPGQPPMPEADKKLILHASLPILAGHVLMGTDAAGGMGAPLTVGNNIYLNLEPDTRAETDRLFAALGAGGKVESPLAEMFWGSYWGTLTDKFGIHWMFNCAGK